MRCSVCNRHLVNIVEDPLHEEDKSHIPGLGARCEQAPKVRIRLPNNSKVRVR